MKPIIFSLLLLLQFFIGVIFAQQDGDQVTVLASGPMNLSGWSVFLLAAVVFAAGFYWQRKLSVERARTEDVRAELDVVKAELEQKTLELQQLATVDFLTGLYNRPKLEESLQSELDRAERYKLMFGVVLFDIDLFRQVNDTYGPDVGDRVLQEIAELLACNTRLTDTAGRWGGEEFIIICSETEETGLLRFAEKLRGIIESYDFPTIEKRTASFGISLFHQGDDKRAIVGRAEEALCRAKEGGRNRVELKR
ncbi:GGDEF domain-containing protein [Malonomonas rubra]|nr:GGDEF domain-containing protein [Malonomonas rubra]